MFPAFLSGFFVGSAIFGFLAYRLYKMYNPDISKK